LGEAWGKSWLTVRVKRAAAGLWSHEMAMGSLYVLTHSQCAVRQLEVDHVYIKRDKHRILILLEGNESDILYNDMLGLIAYTLSDCFQACLSMNSRNALYNRETSMYCRSIYFSDLIKVRAWSPNGQLETRPQVPDETSGDQGQEPREVLRIAAETGEIKSHIRPWRPLMQSKKRKHT
jgi:hypothetical protein